MDRKVCISVDGFRYLDEYSEYAYDFMRLALMMDSENRVKAKEMSGALQRVADEMADVGLAEARGWCYIVNPFIVSLATDDPVHLRKQFNNPVFRGWMEANLERLTSDTPVNNTTEIKARYKEWR